MVGSWSIKLDSNGQDGHLLGQLKLIRQEVATLGQSQILILNPQSIAYTTRKVMKNKKTGGRYLILRDLAAIWILTLFLEKMTEATFRF